MSKDKDIEQEIPVFIQTKVSNIVRSDKFNCRSQLTKERVDEIANSIAEKGVINPPIVREGKDGKYELVAGFTRVAAIEKLGGKDADITARLMSFESEEDAMMVNALENTARNDLLRYDLAKLVHKLVTKTGLQQARVAKNLGISQPWVAQLNKVWEGLSNPVKEWWQTFQDPDKQPAWKDLMAWSKESPQKQKAIIDAIIKGEEPPADDDKGDDESNGDGKGKKRTMKEIKARMETYAAKKEDGKLEDSEVIAYNVLRWVTGEVKSLSLKV